MTENIVETKECKSCGNPFSITDKDMRFYDKISPIFVGKKYQIPTPTLCPDCRQQRRLSRINERKLYKRICDATGKAIISIYSSDKSYKIYDQKIWRSDQRDPMEYGQKYNFSQSFFGQFNALMKKVPIQNLNNINSENSEYCSLGGYNKNCYLIVGNHCENCFYGTYTKESVDCMEYIFSLNNQNCYETVDAVQNTNVFYSQDVENCSNSCFLYNCKNCKNCFGCVNLINKEYYIYNKAYTPKDYKEYIKNIKIDHTTIETTKKEFGEFKKSFPRIFAKHTNCENTSGDNISNVKNTKCCFDANGVENPIEDCAFVSLVTAIKDSYDIRDGGNNSQLCYELTSCGGSHILFSDFVFDSYDVYYSRACFNSSNVFGCIGLRNKEYCILNTQYTKEEYEMLVPQIIEHMKNHSERGEGFPSFISPFGYNETLAQEYFPLNKEEALVAGYTWMDQEYPINISEHMHTMNAHDLPNTISDVSDDIVNKAIICEVTGKPFRILKSELEFYRKHNISVPHKHPDQRHLERMQLRNPRKLRDRTCMKCGIEIKTTYAPERPEIIYCEVCYHKEIYG